MSTADSKLDALLREVPIPDGLLDRLMALPLADDEGIDELVRDVAVPVGLLQRLQAIALADDDGLDEALRNVPVPDDLVTSCRHHARRYLARLEGRHPMDRTLRISRIAMAASLILAVTLSLGSTMLLSVIMNGSGRQVVDHGHDPVPHAPHIPAEKPLQTSWDVLADDSAGPDKSSGLNKAFEYAVRPSQSDTYTRGIELAEIERLAVPASHDLRLPLGADPLNLATGALGSNSWDNLPELPLRVPNLIPHGVDWPVVPGSNGPFLQRWGFLPFVSPGAHPRLQTCPVPLA
ncbi:MAG: hypothetical protein ABSG53_28260, partial [Thermoguttaceae bacterium]